MTPQTEDSLGEVETGHNDNIPQYDGADDLLPLEVHLDLTIPQYDGADNTSKEEPNGPDPIEPSAKRSKQSETVEGSGDTVDSVAVKSDPGKATTPPEVTDELGSDLDDEDDLNDEVDDENISDLILCQYEKISRVRTRWRGVLRAGIIHVRGADFAFSRATTDFDW